MARFVDMEAYDGAAEVSGDVCVAGAGAAGITLAMELARQGVDVLVLESGGERMEGATQILYQAENTGMRYFDMTTCRVRQFGGSTAHWGGTTHYLTRRDLEGDRELGLPAWPVTAAELKPYYQRAATQLAIDWSDYQAQSIARKRNFSASSLIERRSNVFETVSYMQTPRRLFAESFGGRLKADPRSRVFLHANVTRIQLAPDGRSVDHLAVRALNGRALKVRAKRYVLACHAVENARLLLASNDVQRAGVGNGFDHVGRYFMDHIHMRSGVLHEGGLGVPPLYYRDTRSEVALDQRASTVSSLTDAARRRERVMAYYAALFADYADPAAFEALRYLRRSFFKPFEMQMATAAGRVIGDLGATVRLMREEARLRPRLISQFRIHQRIEQAPNPQSRVTVAQETDVLGVPKARLNWEITDLDVRTLNRGQELAVQEMSALGYGRFAVRAFSKADVRTRVLGLYHNMGTTRMSASPSLGVVDADGRVHGVRNLYVAGSSVFPTGGRAGPTMTIIALAIRMADHLAAQRA